MPSRAQFKERIKARAERLSRRLAALSRTLSQAMMLGLACLPALAAPQSDTGAPATATHKAANVPITARRVRAIDIRPAPALVTQRAPRENDSEAVPPVQAPSAPALTRIAETPASPAPQANEPPPDVWPQAVVVAALQECVRELASLSLEVETLPPVKSGQCGAPAPISLRSLGAAKVEMQPAAITTCRMAKALNRWLETIVQPAAREIFASPVKRLIGASSYACRSRNNETGGPISEHAFANAVDIAGFVLADGRTVSVLEGWGTPAREQKGGEKPEAPAKPGRQTAAKTIAPQRLGGPAVAASAGAEPALQTSDAIFLRLVHNGSCGVFHTVLGPEANAYHLNHFHLDLKERKSRTTVCE